MTTLLSEFQQFVQSLSETTTTLEILEDKAKYCDPIRVNNLDVDATYQQLSYVIIRWLVDLHSKKLFNRTTLLHLSAMLQFPDDGAFTLDQRANLMCLLAMCKSDLDGDQLNQALFQINRNRLIDGNTSAWRLYCELIIKHEQINKLVDELLGGATGMPVTNFHPTISVHFVHSPIDSLRGYTGINCIYINWLYIMNRHQVYRIVSDLGEELHDVILKMNLLCIAVHELAHARLRQFLDDPNASSPALLASNPALVSAFGGLPEFGRLCECRLFGDQFDFWNTYRQGRWTDCHSTYFTTFVQAIEANQSLPAFDVNRTPCATRSSRCTMGSDMDTEELEHC